MFILLSSTRYYWHCTHRCIWNTKIQNDTANILHFQVCPIFLVPFIYPLRHRQRSECCQLWERQELTAGSMEVQHAGQGSGKPWPRVHLLWDRLVSVGICNKMILLLKVSIRKTHCSFDKSKACANISGLINLLKT